MKHLTGRVRSIVVRGRLEPGLQAICGQATFRLPKSTEIQVSLSARLAVVQRSKPGQSKRG